MSEGHNTGRSNQVCVAERDLRAMCDALTDIILVTTPQGRVVHANASARRHLGHSAEELATKDVLDLHPAERRTEAALAAKICEVLRVVR